MWVKICGITTEEDALRGCDGRRRVGVRLRTLATASDRVPVVADIVKRLPHDVMTVGLFRDETAERVVETVLRTGLRGAQLHGHETREMTWWIGERVPFVIKAFVAGDRGVADASGYRASAVLLDVPSPGSGKVFDWRLVDGVSDRSRLIVAGGLTPENVGEAIATTHPWGVDVSSGVEQSKGRKDPRKLRAFIANARAAFEAEGPGNFGGSGDVPYDWADEG